MNTILEAYDGEETLRGVVLQLWSRFGNGLTQHLI